MQSPLTYTLEDKVAVLQMDDGKANALSGAMLDALSEALDRAEAEATAVVLTGRPGRFCAGFDLRMMMSSPENARTLLTQGAGVLMKLYGLGMPLVIACTGHALAGGALVLLTGDVRFGAEGDFRLGLNEVQIGMPVPVLAMELARDRIVKRELVQATLGARIYSPAEAALAGYLDVVVPEADVLGKAKAEAARLGALSRPAYAASKVRLRRATIDLITNGLESDMASLMIAPA
ncbi:MAG: Enoyl-CoA hydratase [Labilithrix sp.]|nr:Enoyl-CoA hydratase [Labilithrix sp.]